MAACDRASDGLARAAPHERGVDARAIGCFLDESAALGVELNSFMLWRAGAVVAEGWWWPYGPHRRHMMHSATKSFLSAAIGLAVHEKRFALEDRVISFFPEHIPTGASGHLNEMTVEDLLTQTSGHAHGTSGAKWRSIPTSWIAEFLKIGVPYTPGEKFRYSSATSFMLSAIITKTTGDSAHAYLRPRLLDPLGITDFTWDLGPENINPGGNGVSCHTADLLKLAVLHLQGGAWQGRQVLPAEWVRQATSAQRGNPYGYHWWIGPGNCFYAYGMFGQFAFVFPRHDAILVTTAATAYGEEPLRSIVWHHFPAAFDKIIAAHPASLEQALRDRIQRLALIEPLTASRSALAQSVSGVTFAAEPNEDRIEWLRLTFEGGRCLFESKDAKGQHKVVIGLAEWIEGDTSISGAPLHHGYEPPSLRVVAGGGWKTPDTFEATWQFVETAFRDRVLVRFDDAGGRLTLGRDVNTNSMSPVRPPIVARRVAR